MVLKYHLHDHNKVMEVETTIFHLFMHLGQALCEILTIPTQSTVFWALFASVPSGWATTMTRLLGTNRNYIIIIYQRSLES